jgi:hypothetical protein
MMLTLFYLMYLLFFKGSALPVSKPEMHFTTILLSGDTTPIIRSNSKHHPSSGK